MGPIVVLKVGTSSLVDTKTQKVKVLSVARVADTTSKLKAAGFEVIIVTSGAVGLGCARLGHKEKPASIAGKQAAAAVGQLKLLSVYDDLFSQLGHIIAQVLLTYDTFGDRAQYMNARNTFHALLSQSCVPIVNENDTVAVQELRVGDNDSLSALVANMVGASWLFLLTDVDSLYTANPREDAAAAPIRIVRASEQVHNLRKQMSAGVSRLDPDVTVEVQQARQAGQSTAAAAGAGLQSEDGRHGSAASSDDGSASEGESPRSKAQATGVAGSAGAPAGAGAAPSGRQSNGRRSRSPQVPKVSGSGSALVSATGGAVAATSSRGGAGSAFGTGGMATKLRAALLGTAAGVTVVIMNSERIDAVHNILCTAAREAAGDGGPTVLSAPNGLSLGEGPTGGTIPEHTAQDGAKFTALRPTLFADKGEGTTFLPAANPVTGRKRWILSLAPQGTLVLDAGAVGAVVDQRKSLYSAGVKEVRGDFGAMDAVSLVDECGRVLAHALCNYSHDEAARLKGRHSRDFPEALGYVGREALCDRDNIVLL